MYLNSKAICHWMKFLFNQQLNWVSKYHFYELNWYGNNLAQANYIAVFNVFRVFPQVHKTTCGSIIYSFIHIFFGFLFTLACQVIFVNKHPVVHHSLQLVIDCSTTMTLWLYMRFCFSYSPMTMTFKLICSSILKLKSIRSFWTHNNSLRKYWQSLSCLCSFRTLA